MNFSKLWSYLFEWRIWEDELRGCVFLWVSGWPDGVRLLTVRNVTRWEKTLLSNFHKRNWRNLKNKTKKKQVNSTILWIFILWGCWGLDSFQKFCVFININVIFLSILIVFININVIVFFRTRRKLFVIILRQFHVMIRGKLKIKIIQIMSYRVKYFSPFHWIRSYMTIDVTYYIIYQSIWISRMWSNSWPDYTRFVRFHRDELIQQWTPMYLVGKGKIS